MRLIKLFFIGWLMVNAVSPTLAGPIPFYSISQINHVNGVSGEPDSIGVHVVVRGVVYGFNQRTTGIRFTIRDQTGGIVINGNKTYGYVVKEGDSIEARGFVSVFRGLTMISTLDTIIKLGSNHQLKSPTIADTLKEKHESDLVKVMKLSFYRVPLGFTWDTIVYKCQPNKSYDTVAVHILNKSAIYGKSFPAGFVFNVTGIVTQVSSDSFPPYAFNGYEILVRSLADIEVVEMLSPFDLLLPSNNATINLSGDTSQTVTFRWNASVPAIDTTPTIYVWMMDSTAGNFNTPFVEFVSGNGGKDTSVTISYGVMRTILTTFGIDSGQYLQMKWRVLSNTLSDTRASNQTYLIGVIMGGQINSAQPVRVQQVAVYPNPFTSELRLQLDADEECRIEMFDITGKMHLTANSSGTLTQLNTETLAPGVYFVRVYSAGGVFTKKIIRG